MKNYIFVFHTVVLLTISAIAGTCGIYFHNPILQFVDWGCFLGAIVIASIKFYDVPLKVFLLVMIYWLSICFITTLIITHGK